MAPRALYEMTSFTSHDVDSVSSVCGIDEKNYSSLRRLLRVTVYCCLKFIWRRIWLTLSQSMKESIERRQRLLYFVLSSLSDGHSVDLQVATLLWVSVVQQ